MKFKAVILVFIFLLGGNGLSIDIARCCNEIAGVSVGFASARHTHEKMTCCPSFRNIKPNKSCCENTVISTVINSVPGVGKSYKSLDRPFESAKPLISVHSTALSVSEMIEVRQIFDGFDHNYPIPILLKKRVLTI